MRLKLTTKRNDGGNDVHLLGVAGAAAAGAIPIGVVVWLVAFAFVDLPGYAWNREASERVMQMEILDHVLRDSLDHGRRESLRLLVAADILDCNAGYGVEDCGKLTTLLNDPDWTPPSWSEIAPRFSSRALEVGLHKGSYSPEVPKVE